MSANIDYKQTSVKFSAEDQVRISRIREELVVRITEISLIMARTLGVKAPEDIREFLITDGPTGEALELSVLRTSAPSAGAEGTAKIITWGCTCHTNKVCCNDPDCPPCGPGHGG